ncbi:MULTISPECIES: hypothetical protein [Flavobacteriales]|uniref:Uncharacterized protein n=2 Tax=Chryseobacterium TaxID=59732 RepID=A0AAJ1R0F8_9FLAO|nr:MULTISPECIES: hypothetical protein [Flavobacteriales]MBF6645686.1 hypothetical protein [Chryseobacterium indologenes]MDN4011321.1 hypothetical protein [Chryseobacterium gambrini]NML59258.1 hypothetical protein [Chryseobacterium cheonjiense]QQQ70642.1 hypothetical protein JHW31_19525 [Chryseobacterium indologenes]QWA38092.1 hypothetical protein KKI44_19710 [Chryseobacterium sp. ZHDP1]
MKNWNKHITIVLWLFWGFLLAPNISYACSKAPIKTEQQKFSKNHHEKAEKKDCCKTKSCKKCKDGNGCGGNCKHNSCKCGVSSPNSLSVPIAIELKAKNYFAETKKQKFGFKEAYYSSGFFSIWLPPKIS